MTTVLLAAIGAAAVGAAAQAVTGFGFALVAVPLLALAVPTGTAVVAVTILSAAMTAGATARERGSVDRRLTVRVLLAATVGMPFGLLAFVLLPARALTFAVAGTAVFFLLYPAVRRRWSGPDAAGSTLPAGFVSGAALTSTGMNGPPLVAALNALRLPPREQRATLQAIFTLQDVIAVAMFAAAGQTSARIWAAAAVALPAVALGWFAGDHLFRRLADAQVRIVVTSLLITTVLVLVARAAWP